MLLDAVAGGPVQKDWFNRQTWYQDSFSLSLFLPLFSVLHVDAKWFYSNQAVCMTTVIIFFIIIIIFACGLPKALGLENWGLAGEFVWSLGQHHLSCILASGFDIFLQNLKNIFSSPFSWGVSNGSIGLGYWKMPSLPALCHWSGEGGDENLWPFPAQGETDSRKGRLKGVSSLGLIKASVRQKHKYLFVCVRHTHK